VIERERGEPQRLQNNGLQAPGPSTSTTGDKEKEKVNSQWVRPLITRYASPTGYLLLSPLSTASGGGP